MVNGDCFFFFFQWRPAIDKCDQWSHGNFCGFQAVWLNYVTTYKILNLIYGGSVMFIVSYLYVFLVLTSKRSQ